MYVCITITFIELEGKSSTDLQITASKDGQNSDSWCQC